MWKKKIRSLLYKGKTVRIIFRCKQLASLRHSLRNNIFFKKDQKEKEFNEEENY